jgi:flagellar motor protein MotB
MVQGNTTISWRHRPLQRHNSAFLSLLRRFLMAVSQFLRPGSLMEAVKGYLTPDAVRSASSLVGESESSTRQTLNGAVPSILSGLTNMVSTRDGATGLASLIRDGSFGSVVDNVGSLFSGGSATTSILSVGPHLLGKIFGGNSSQVTDLVARSGGVSNSSASSLMSLTAPLILGVLGKRAAAQGLDSSGMANSLLSEKADFAAAAPAGLSQILGGGPTLVSRTIERATEAPRFAASDVRRESYATPGHEAEPRRPGFGRWLPLLLIALGILALLSFLRGRASRPGVGPVSNTTSNIVLPGGGSISAATGSLNYNLLHFLADNSAQAPQTFVFDHLNFQSGSSQITPDSLKTVNDLAQILKAYPNVQIQVTGHTDNSGNAETNQALSLARAEAVKAELVSQGVSADRVATQGFGEDRPIASNTTEEGRARNRRIELNVTRK